MRRRPVAGGGRLGVPTRVVGRTAASVFDRYTAASRGWVWTGGRSLLDCPPGVSRRGQPVAPGGRGEAGLRNPDPGVAGGRPATPERDKATIRPWVAVRAVVNRRVTSAQLTTFHQAAM